MSTATAHGGTRSLLVTNRTQTWEGPRVFRGAAGADMTATPENKALLLSRVEAHIRGVVGHYGADIPVWDVVNEVVDEGQPDGMRRSPLGVGQQITEMDVSVYTDSGQSYQGTPLAEVLLAHANRYRDLFGVFTKYRDAISSPGGFLGSARVTNRGPVAINSWKVTWSYADDQRITQLWNGVHTQDGAAVAVRNAPWNSAIPVGESRSFGFLGTWSGANGTPTAFTLNDAVCRRT